MGDEKPDMVELNPKEFKEWLILAQCFEFLFLVEILISSSCLVLESFRDFGKKSDALECAFLKALNSFSYAFTVDLSSRLFLKKQI